MSLCSFCPPDKPQQHFSREETLSNEQQHSSLNQEAPEPPEIKEEPLEVSLSDTTMMTGVGGQHESRQNLDPPNSVRELIVQRLMAAAEDIYTGCQQTINLYQEEILEQQRLLSITLVRQIKLHRIGMDTHIRPSWLLINLPSIPGNPGRKREDHMLFQMFSCSNTNEAFPGVSSDDPDQQMNISLEHQEPGTSQNEEQEEPESTLTEEVEVEFNRSHDEEQLVLKQEVDSSMMTPASEQSELIEPEPDSELLLSQDSVVARSQREKKIHLVGSGSTTKAGEKSKKRCHNENVDNSSSSKSSGSFSFVSFT